MNKNKSLIIIVILAIIVAGVSFFAIHQMQQNKEMSELFAIEKMEMENEYSTFATQYDELQIQINNDSLREKLESEKLKTQRLLEELRQVKTSNAAEIMRLKKELKTVRAVLRSYVMQIDSLNKINAALQEENKEVKSKYSAATRQISNLSKEKESLNEKVTLASQLDATNIVTEPLNKRNREARKAKDVKKLAVSFARSFSDLTDEQLKDNWKEDYPEKINKIKTAIAETSGEYLTYNGEIVNAMFFSTSVGATENSEEVFVSALPYLRSVDSTWDKESPVYIDTYTFTLEDFYKKLNLPYNQTLKIEVTEKTSTGRTKTIKINGEEMKGRDLATKLSLRSNYFDIVQNQNNITITTKGFGHGVGMSQYGANGMAKEGYKYDQILKHYYKNTEIKKN